LYRLSEINNVKRIDPVRELVTHRTTPTRRGTDPPVGRKQDTTWHRSTVNGQHDQTAQLPGKCFAMLCFAALSFAVRPDEKMTQIQPSPQDLLAGQANRHIFGRP
ncbi:hypothetical protein, partial [Burkholderia cenocepacia]|uniref:hypothetical protein n=1 Tax=Burkholderia cenocepacia TaxID=95486 RepID=UPI002AB68C3E